MLLSEANAAVATLTLQAFMDNLKDTLMAHSSAGASA